MGPLSEQSSCQPVHYLPSLLSWCGGGPVSAFSRPLLGGLAKPPPTFSSISGSLGGLLLLLAGVTALPLPQVPPYRRLERSDNFPEPRAMLSKAQREP